MFLGSILQQSLLGYCPLRYLAVKPSGEDVLAIHGEGDTIR
jgi:hypothetical protein